MSFKIDTLFTAVRAVSGWSQLSVSTFKNEFNLKTLFKVATLAATIFDTLLLADKLLGTSLATRQVNNSLFALHCVVVISGSLLHHSDRPNQTIIANASALAQQALRIFKPKMLDILLWDYTLKGIELCLRVLNFTKLKSEFAPL